MRLRKHSGARRHAYVSAAYVHSDTNGPPTYCGLGRPLIIANTPSSLTPQIFFSVYEMAIDTTLLSLCEDSESNGGHPRYAPPLLMEAINEPYPRESDGGGGGGVKKRGSGHH
mgnify:CR=1 FL=1